MNLLYVVESGDYKYLVFDEMPDKISTKYGDDTIIGRIGGVFYDFLAKRITVKLKYVEKRVLDAFTDNGIDLSNYTHCIIVKRNFYLAW